MKKPIIQAAFMLGLALAVVQTGCSSTPTRESTGEYIDDTVITTKVKTQLAADKGMSLLNITVETYKGAVQLSGFVDTYEHSKEAERIAKQVTGVKKVINSLTIKPK